MKNKLLLTAVLAAVTVGVSSSLALAQTEPTTTNDTTTTPTTTISEEDKAELKQRVEERKNRLKTRLDTNQFKRLTERCSGAQGKLNSLIVRFENSDKPYRVKYDNYLQRLEKLQTRLKDSDVDTAELDAEIDVLKLKIETLKTAVDRFVQSVNDAKLVDCKADPTGFRAALDDAKTQALALKAARADLEQYARETIKVTIEKLKAQRAQSTTQNTENTEQGEEQSGQ